MFDVKLKENFKLFVSGPSRCGKTFFIADLLQNITNFAKQPPTLVVYIYKVWQGLENLKNKNTLKFINFDICEFYPSITPELLKRAITFAEKHTNISKLEKEAIFEARKCFLFSDSKPWEKRNNPDFDVTMGAWDGAECCELVGLYMLDKLKILGLNIGLYRDERS